MSCDWDALQGAMTAEDSGISSEALPSMERQGSRMQVDEDSRNARYQTDTFRMLGYKVVPCCKRFKHHWNSCPFLHPNERAKRRDPRLYYYESTMCPAVKNSDDKRKLACPQKDQCRFAHNVFEEYLHPDRYRTVMCKDFPRCNRDVCFFAHTQDEIRRVDQAWSWNQLARDHFRVAPLSAFLSATGGLKVSPIASAITRLLYSSRVEEARRTVADTVGKMFRECWKLDNPEAAVLIEALALQAELPLVLQPDVEKAVKKIRRSGPRRQSGLGRDGVLGTGFLSPDSPLPGYDAFDFPSQNSLPTGLGSGLQQNGLQNGFQNGLANGFQDGLRQTSTSWPNPVTSSLDEDSIFSRLSLLASLGLSSKAEPAPQANQHWSNLAQDIPNRLGLNGFGGDSLYSDPLQRPSGLAGDSLYSEALQGVNAFANDSLYSDTLQGQAATLDQRTLQRILTAMGTSFQ